MSTGSVDFWPNSGNVQAGCPPFNPATAYVPNSKQIFNSKHLFYYFFPTCSFAADCDHSRAWVYYAESVLRSKSNDSFLAVKCASWNDFVSNQCSNQTGQMGFNANPSLQGDYFLQTNTQSEFSRDRNGILYR